MKGTSATLTVLCVCIVPLLGLPIALRLIPDHSVWVDLVMLVGYSCLLVLFVSVVHRQPRFAGEFDASNDPSAENSRGLDTPLPAGGAKLPIDGKPPANGSSILVVDDGDENRELMAVVLEEAGFNVETAENGKFGVEKALSQSFDVILMDMQMPVMDGFTATGMLRQKGLTMPIVALTAYEESLRDRLIEGGCSQYLTKPVDIGVLLETIGELVGVQVDGSICGGGDSVDRERQAVGAPIVSSLPTTHPRYERVIRKFVDRLDEQLLAMQQAQDARDFEGLAKLAHWLKGSGGTVGFDDFTSPATRLEQAAANQDAHQVETLLALLRELRSRLQVPVESASTATEVTTRDKPEIKANDAGKALFSRLPDSPRFNCLVEQFSSRLTQELDVMDEAWIARDIEALSKFAHWLKGSGGTLGFDEFTPPASKLEQMMIEGESDGVAAVLAELAELSKRIRLRPDPEPRKQELAP